MANIKTSTLVLIICMAYACAFSQTFHEDTLAVRAICDSNGLGGININSLYNVENERVVSLIIGDEFIFQNCISIIPADIERLTALRNLTIIIQKLLTTLPPEIGNLKALDTLIVQECGLTELPDEIGGCSALKVLDVNHNEIDSLPPTVGNLSSLRTLNIKKNHISALPNSIGNLDSLVGLYCFGNIISSLPSEIGDLSSVITMDLSGNSLNNLPNDIGKLSSLDKLYLYNNQFDSFPSPICDLSNIRSLWIHANKLISLPPEIGNLISLKTFSLHSNKLNSIPSEICNIKNLQVLYIQDNELITLPSDFGNIDSLKKVDLSNNSLTSLPNSITNLNISQGPSGINLCFNPDLVFTEDQQVWADAMDYSEYEQKYCDTEIGDNLSKAAKYKPALLSFSRNVVRYTVQNPSHVLLEIFNVKGKKLKTLFNGYKNTGVFTIKYYSEISGVYLIKLKIGNVVVVNKNLIIQ